MTPFCHGPERPMSAQALADGKKHVVDDDVLALVSDQVHQPEKLWDLLGLQVLTRHSP